MEIGNKEIGEKSAYIIAEIGLNHNGSFDIAKKLIKIAKNCGADAAKFQKRNIKKLYIEEYLDNPNVGEQSFRYLIPLLKKFELTDEEFVKLKEYCDEIGIEFLCSPWDIDSVDLLEKLGVSAYKIASADMSNFPLLDYVTSKGKPIIISTGMHTVEEIEKSYLFLNGVKADFALLHCNSTYPAPLNQLNLCFIRTMKDKFSVPIGYSGHELGFKASMIAVAIGAVIIEKHLTLDRSMEGPDHRASLEPTEFEELVQNIRLTEEMMGDELKSLSRGEILNRETLSKSIYASVEIPKGTAITKGMLTVKGPGKGIPPNRMDEIIGLKAWRRFKKDELIKYKSEKISKKFEFNPKYRWGFKGRYPDLIELAKYNPKVYEFHFTNEDVFIDFYPDRNYNFELIVHAPEYLGHKMVDLCNPNENQRQESVALINKCLDRIRELAPYFNGPPRMVLHPGGMALTKQAENGQLYKNCKEALNELNTKGVELLLENLPPFPWYFGGQWFQNAFADAHEMAEFFKQIDSNIMMCFDTSHAKLYCNYAGTSLLEFIKEIKPYINHVHISDAAGVDREGLQIGEGEINFKEMFKELSDIDYSFIPEIWRGHLNNNRDYFIALNRLKRYLI